MNIIERFREKQNNRKERADQILRTQEQIAALRIFHGNLEGFNQETGQEHELIPIGKHFLSGNDVFISQGRLRRKITISEVKLQAIRLGADALVDYHRFMCNPKERGIPVRRVRTQNSQQ